MKKAIQIPYNELFEKKCRYAAEAGFKFISVNFYELVDKTEKEWDEVVDNIRRILDETGISCIQSHPYYYDLLTSSEIVEERFEFAIKQAIIATAKLGGKWCALHPRTSLSSGYQTSKSLEDNKRCFSEYLELAIKHGTKIAAENLPIFPGIIPIIPFYSSNFEDLCILTDSFNDENMKICWDFGHANMLAFNQADAIRTLGKRIACTHVHNNFKKQDLHLPPDCGNIEWDKVMKAMAEVGYDGPLTLETHCLYVDDELLKSFAEFNYAGLVYLEQFAK